MADHVRAALLDLERPLPKQGWEAAAAARRRLFWVTDCRSLEQSLNSPQLLKVGDKRLQIELSALWQGLWRRRGGMAGGRRTRTPRWTTFRRPRTSALTVSSGSTRGRCSRMGSRSSRPMRRSRAPSGAARGAGPSTVGAGTCMFRGLTVPSKERPLAFDAALHNAAEFAPPRVWSPRVAPVSSQACLSRLHP